MDLILFLCQLVGIFIKSHTLRHIGRILAEIGGQQDTVVAVHQFAARVVGGELMEILYCCHLVHDFHFGIGVFLHQKFDHFVDQTCFAEGTVVDANGFGLLAAAAG